MPTLWNGRRILAMLIAALMLLAACGDNGGDDAAADADDDAADAGNDEPAEEEDADADDDADDADANDPDDDADGDDADDADDAAAADGDPAEIDIVAFSPPSLGAFLPAVIADQRFDLDNGLDIDFVHRPPDAYNTEFSTGQFQIGGSGSLMSEAVRLSEGVDIMYLFNIHDYWGALLSTDPSLTEITDLEGRSMSGTTASTTYAMFLWFAQAAGVDIANVTVENHPTAALGTQAQTSRTDFVQLAEPAYTTLMAQDLDHLVDIPLPFELWEEEFGSDDIPFLGVAAHREWVEENPDLVPLLHSTYVDAADWSLANPDEAAEIIADSMEGGTGDEAEALADLLADNDRLGLNVRWASEVAEGIEAVFEAGVDIEYFDTPPEPTLIYEGN